MKNPYISYNPKLVEKARENRRNQTPAEKKMLMLVIEVDGDSHIKQKEYDMLRSEKLEEYGIKVIRYQNYEIMSNIEAVYKDLKKKIKSLPQNSPLIRGARGG